MEGVQVRGAESFWFYETCPQGKDFVPRLSQMSFFVLLNVSSKGKRVEDMTDNRLQTFVKKLYRTGLNINKYHPFVYTMVNEVASVFDFRVDQNNIHNKCSQAKKINKTNKDTSLSRCWSVGESRGTKL